MPGEERPPLGTYVLLVANLVVFAAATNAGGTENPTVLEDFGALFGPLVAAGQYWRLFTAMFLHIGIAHLVFNLLGLFLFGRAVEQIFGTFRFLVSYVLAGLVGSIASYVFNPAVLAAGASGAIFGVLGALVSYLAVQREVFGRLGQRELTSILFLAAMNLLYGLTTQGIDNWAHIGGFAAGIFLGLALSPRYRLAMSGARDASVAIDRPSRLKWLVVPAALALVASGAFVATRALPDNAYSHIYEAERYFEQKDYETARAELDQALSVDELNGEAHLLRGRIFAELGDPPKALADLGIALHFGRAETRAEARELIPNVSASRGLNR